MVIETLEHWRELDDVLGDPGFGMHEEHARSTLVFRGLARGSYSNVSSLARLEGDFTGVERHLLRNFRKYAHQAAPGPTAWDWLALGQHHGLPTRLLDWTFSPLVALHFATGSWPEEDALLWAVDCQAVHRGLPKPLRDALDAEGSLVFTTGLLTGVAADLKELDELDDEPFALFFEPPTISERMAQQAAVLSVVNDPRLSFEEVIAGQDRCARAWRIVPELKEEVRARLDRDHITERTLLGGLDGLAAYLRRYYSPRSNPSRAQQEGSMA